MKNFNLIEWLQTDSHGKQSATRDHHGTKSRELAGNPRPLRYPCATLALPLRYVAMITLLLTLVCGNVWGATYYVIPAKCNVSAGALVAGADGSTQLFKTDESTVTVNTDISTSVTATAGVYYNSTSTTYANLTNTSNYSTSSSSSRTMRGIKLEASVNCTITVNTKRFSKLDVIYRCASTDSKTLTIDGVGCNTSDKNFHLKSITKAYSSNIIISNGSDKEYDIFVILTESSVKCTLSYDANGGTGSMPTHEFASGTTVYAGQNAGFTPPSGKIFKCWNTKANGSGTEYKEWASFTLSANTTLYAQWITASTKDTYCISMYNLNVSDQMKYFTYSGYDDMQILDLEVPDYKTSTNNFWVGKGGSWKSGDLGNSSASSANERLEDLCLKGNRGTKLGTSGQGVLARFFVYDNSTYNNIYIEFTPKQYSLIWGEEGSSWNPVKLYPSGYENEWTSEVVTLTSDHISNDDWKYYVGILKADNGVASWYKSKTSIVNTMGTYNKRTDSWGGNVSTLSAGAKGFFRMWQDATSYDNWRCHFVPVYTLSYNANSGTGAPANAYVASEGDAAARTIKVSTTEPTRTGYTFTGWATTSGRAASGTVDYVAGTAITISANTELFAVWTCIVPDAPTADKITVTPSCAGTGATFSANTTGIPSYVTWYWQTAADGTSTTYPASSSYTTATSAGSYTMYLRAKNTACGEWSASGDTPSKSVKVKTPVTASWSTAPANGTADGNMNASLTTNYASGVVYTSSNTSVATVSGNGTKTCTIDYKAAGTARITATVTGAGDDYCSTASCYTDITVVEPSYSVTYDGDNCTKKTGGTSATRYTDFTATFQANTHYTLPSTITVTIGGDEVTVDTEYTWSISEGVGTVSIDGDYITGAIVITVDGVADQFDVTLSYDGDEVSKKTGSTGTNAATYGTDYVATFQAKSGYTLQDDVTVTIGASPASKGTEYTWSISEGVGTLSIGGSYITDDIEVTVDADVDVTTYSVTYAKPDGASGTPPTDATEYDSGDEVTVKSNTDIAKDGTTFRGWTDGTTFYLVGQKFNITSNVTLTAVLDESAAGSCELVNIDFTDETTVSLSTTDTKTVDGVSVYFKGFSSITNGTGAIPSGNMSSNANYLAIPISGINGSISFTVTGETRPQLKYYILQYDALPGAITDPGNTTDISRPSSGSSVTVSDVSVSKSYAVLYLGRKSATNQIGTVSVTTSCSVSSGYKVTFDKGSGPSTVTGMPDDIEGVPSGLKILKPATDPTATGYTFDKWVTTNDGSTPFDFANTTISTDKTIYASWTANTYNVSLTLTDDLATKKSGSTGTNAATYGTDHTLTFEAESGYALPSDVTVTIGGEDAAKGTEYSWSISDGVGTLIIDGSYILGNIAITVTAEVAKADPEVYTVSGTTSVCEGDEATITLSDSESGVTYHLYKGEDDQDDDKVGDGNEITWTVTAAGTYTVKVEEDEDYNEADMDGSAVISYKTATAIGTPPTAAVSGHDGVDFTLGSDLAATGEGTLTYQWYSYTTAEGAGQATVGSATTTKTLTTSKAAGTYYYKVEVIATCGSVKSSMITVTIDNKHLLTYDANGGEGAPDAEFRAAGSAALSATEPTRTNYRFLGWNTENDGTGDHYDAGASFTMGSSAVTLYAEWGETATLTWNLNVNTAESSIGTASKASTNARISNSTDMANLANYGSLTITSSAKESLTSKIETPTTYTAGKYMYVTFDMPDNYEFVPTSISVKVQPVGKGEDKYTILDISDENSHSLRSTATKCDGTSDGKTTTVSLVGDGTSMTGTVTLKIYVYNYSGESTTNNCYRLGSPITIAGNVNYVCPERPTITSPTAPQSIKLYTDQSKTLTVAATAYSSGTLHYQWKKDGVNIVGATSASHTVYGSIDGTAGETYVYTCDVTQTSPDACATVTSPAVSITFASTSCGYAEIASAVLTSKSAATLNNATLLVNGLADISSGSCKLNGKGAYFGLQLASGSFQVGDSIEFKIKKNNSTDIYLFATTDTTGLQTTDAIYTQSVTDGDNIIKFVVTSGSMLTALNTSKKVAVVRRTKDGVLNQNHSVYYVKVKRYACPDIFIYDDAADNGLWSDDDNWIGPAGHGSGLPTSEDRVFINESVTVDVATAAAAELHITNGSMVTVEKSITVGDVNIETGSTLNVAKDGESGITVATNSLYLKGGWNSSYTTYDMPRIYIDPASTLTKEEDVVNLDISVDTRNFYPIAVPFRVRVKDVDYANSFLAGYSNYGLTGQYVIKEYDGARRAEKGPDQKNNWKVVPETDPESGDDVYLEPGKGYILTAVSLPAYGGGVIRFPLSFSNDWTDEGEQGTIDDSYYKNVVAVTAHTGKATEGDKYANKGWNLLGVPFMSCYTTSDDMGTSVVMQGKFNFDDGTWDGKDKHRYVNVPLHDFSEYVQADMEDEETPTVLRPGWCFFVQIGTTGSLTFQTTKQAEESELPIYAPKRTTGMPTVKTGIVLSGNGASDKTTLLISDKYNGAEYEINADLEKMFGNGYTLATYSLSNDTRLAYNAMSRSDAQLAIPIGYRAPAEGSYTFSINPRYAESGAFSRVDLIDYEAGTLTNLLMSDYTFTTERTQNDTRFAINAVLAPQVTTDIENGANGANDANDANGVRKVLINNELYIVVDGKMFDATGKVVKGGQK